MVVVTETSLVEYVMVNPMMFRLARLAKLLRLLRLVKSFSLFAPMHLMAQAIHASVTVLMWSLILLVLIISVVAMFVSALLDRYMRDNTVALESREEVYDQWGSFTRASVTMFEITLANWGPRCRLLMTNVGEVWALFFIAYRCTVGFAIVQVIMSVFIQQTFKVASRDEQVMISEKSAAAKACLRNLKHLFQALDVNEDGFITKEEFVSVLSDRTVAMWFAAVELEAKEVSELFDLMDDGGGKIACDQFIQAVQRLRGGAKTVDILGVQRDVRTLTQQVQAISGLQLLEEDDGRARVAATLAARSREPASHSVD
eukprot:NODE_1162_length_1225_cov_574.024786.p1 GENE.NODE_1162_length_1225_cov_574.024786~~NODE_1162_length_1225_cov_574.024786.p1  ORF type:complete len:315 (-),score=132.91 NODE_1162_length_1225_cov_574.024786:263-1207(-)